MARPGVIVLVAVAAALVAGCGGSEDQSAAVGWADDVCSAMTTWMDSIAAATESLEADGGAENRLETAIDDARDATNALADELRGLGPPDTDAGAQAETALDTLAADIERGVETIEAAAADVSGASDALSAVSTISGTLVTMGDQVSATFDELEQLDAGGELENAFEQAESCADLRSRSS